MAFFLATMMFSLAGVPPLAGFFAKFYVFAAAMKAGLYGLSVIGVLGERGSRLLLSEDRQADVFRRAGCQRSTVRAPVARIVLAVSALMIILFVFAPSPITNAAMAAAQSLF